MLKLYYTMIVRCKVTPILVNESSYQGLVDLCQNMWQAVQCLVNSCTVLVRLKVSLFKRFLSKFNLYVGKTVNKIKSKKDFTKGSSDK